MKYHTFLPQFHALILAETKRTTLRGSTRVKPGERFALRCWTARPYGSPMGFLGTAMCSNVQRVSLSSRSVVCSDERVQWADSERIEEFARLDGFPSWAALVEHFGKRLPFEGVRISWSDFAAGAP